MHRKINLSNDELVALRRQWVEARRAKHKQVGNFLGYAWYRLIPRLLGASSVLGVLLATVRVFVTIAIASAPFWIDFVTGAELATSDAIVMTLALACLMMIAWLHDVVWRRGRDRQRLLQIERLIASKEAELHRDLAEITNPAEKVQGEREKTELTRILSLMVDRVRQHVRNFDDTAFQATLFLFADDELQDFTVRARARADRETGHTVRCTETAAYFCTAYNAGEAHTVHDIKRLKLFPSSLSDGSHGARYRSILILPLAKRDQQQDGFRALGVVTIDSRRRYEFWGPVRGNLESLIAPYKQWILALIDDHPHSMRVPRRSK